MGWFFEIFLFLFEIVIIWLVLVAGCVAIERWIDK